MRSTALVLLSVTGVHVSEFVTMMKAADVSLIQVGGACYLQQQLLQQQLNALMKILNR